MSLVMQNYISWSVVIYYDCFILLAYLCNMICFEPRTLLIKRQLLLCISGELHMHIVVERDKFWSLEITRTVTL